MTPKEKRGRFYVAAFIAIIVLFDLCTKGLLLLGGTMRWSQLGGTIVTVVTCWFFWRGSKFAHGFLTICIVAAIALVQFGFPPVPTFVLAIAFTLLGLLLLILAAPATRQFTAFQRSNKQAQPSIPADA
ncbi:hypothetical protein [Rhodoferax sp. OV413]|uniref:hypothetical protein n=1 Tax=Rhodoferax sp. OV413 TaxID=1855285 RepID=UPI000B83E6FA|nr:hypothetical protein [Rhodoferax sp. OV413]